MGYVADTCEGKPSPVSKISIATFTYTVPDIMNIPDTGMSCFWVRYWVFRSSGSNDYDTNKYNSTVQCLKVLCPFTNFTVYARALDQIHRVEWISQLLFS